MDLPELTDVTKVWFSDWYDGPVTGVAVHDGHEFWFANDESQPWDVEPRVYVLHRLTAEQLTEAWQMHRDFAAAGYPGCLHTPHCPVTNTPAAAAHDRWPPEQEDAYLEAPAVGWFRDAAHPDQ